MKPKSKSLFRSALVSALALSSTAHAADGTWTNVASGNWSTGPWTGGVPSAASETATFNQNWTGQTINVDGTYTLGSILATDTTAGGNPALLISGGVLILNNGVNKPVIQATTFAEFTRFKLTTELQGVNGFEKTGNGYLDLTGSVNTFTGNIKLNGGGGFVVLDNDANLGNSTNDTDVATTASATGFYVNNGVTVTLNSGRNIALTGGGNFWGKTKNTGNLIIEGQISGTGGFLKNDSGIVTLRGANSYNGATTLQSGTLKLETGNNRLPTGTTLAYIENTILDIGGFSQQVAALTVTAGKQVTAQNGNLSVIGNSDLNLSSNATGVTHNFSGLTNFTYDGSGLNSRAFTLRNTAGTAFDVTARLAAGANVITVKSVDIGSAGPSSDLALTRAVLRMGATNTINADNMAIGGYRSDGLVNFDTGVSDGSLKIRGLDTSSAMASLKVGQVNSGNTTRVATLDLTGGTLDAKVGTFLIGEHYAGANNLVNAAVIMPGGTLEATSLILGDKSGAAGTPTLQSTFTQGGGTVKATTLTFGQQSGAGGATPVLKPTYNLNGGTLFAQTIGGGAGTFNTTTSDRRLSIDGGNLRNLDASTDLSVNGVDGTAGGQLKIIAGASGATFNADASRMISLGANTALSGAGAISKSGNGTLLINGTSSSYTGTLSVDAGTLGGEISLGGNVTVGASGKLAPGASTGTIGTIATKGTTWTGGSIWEFDLSAGTPGSSDLLSIDGNFTKGGSGTYQFNFMNSSPTVWGATYTLVSWTGTNGFSLGDFSYTNLGGTYDGQPGTGFSFSGNSLTFTAVPEPSSALAGLLITAGLMHRRRK